METPKPQIARKARSLRYDLRSSVLSAIDALIGFDRSFEGVPGVWTQNPNALRLVLSHRIETLLCDERAALTAKERKSLARVTESKSLIRLGGANFSKRNADAGWERLMTQAEQARAIVERLPALPPPVRPAPDLRIERFTAKHVDNPAPPRERARITERFWKIRDWLRIATAWHGIVGPDDEPPRRKHVDYWLVEDQYNDERYHFMEVHTPAAATPGWLADVVRVLAAYPGWGVGVTGLHRSFLLIFGDRLLVKGAAFRRCATTADVLAVMPTLIG